MNFVAIDFETANRDPASVCSLGIVSVTNGVISERQQWLIRPRNCTFDPWNTKAHGICASDVSEAPMFEELWPTINKYVENRVIVAHNASFDVNVLRHAVAECNLPYPSFEAVCSLKAAREAWPNLQDYKLSTISAMLSIGLNHHNSLSDAEAAANIILAAKELLSFRTIHDFILGYNVDTSNVKLNIDNNFWDDVGFDIHCSDDQIKRQQSANKVKVGYIDQLEKTGFINNYNVSLISCECRDYVVRRLPCKHMYRLAIDLGIFNTNKVKANGSVAVSKKRNIKGNDPKIHGDSSMQISISLEDVIREIVNNLQAERESGNLSKEEYEKKMDQLRHLLVK